MKRSLLKTASIIAAAAAVAAFSGCAGSADTGSQETAVQETEADTPEDNSAETVSVALWGAQLLEDYAPWLQEKFPDVNFDFYIGTNRAEYFGYCAEKGILPDILTVRRFSLRDVEGIRNQLLDLSETELAGSFYQSYLSNYTYSDGTVNWLPSAAELYDIMVNKTLFDENNIPLPTDWDSFAYACGEFEKLGIQGFASDFVMDYTCTNNLQGFSINSLMSPEGREWRTEYESELVDELDEDIWMPAFEKMTEFIKCAGINEDNLSLTTSDITAGFENGEIAMICISGTEFTDYSDKYERVVIPYPGETAEDGWYLTCPTFQVAANAKCAEDPEREELIMEIITAMLSEEGVSHISSGKSLVAYKKDIDLEVLDELEDLKTYAENNKIYLRLASSEFFSASKDVVTKMIKGEITNASDAFDEFNRDLADDTAEEAPAVMHLDRGYSQAFKNGSGNEAASAIYNTVREELGVDCVIGQSAIVGADIPEGDYTETEMSYVTVGWDNGSLLKKDLTGTELKEVVQYMLSAKGTRDTVVNDSTLPVSSGFEMELKKGEDGYTVDRLTINGEEMSDDRTYTVVVRINYRFNVADFEAAGFTDFEKLDTKLNTLVKARLIEQAGQLAEPTGYVTVENE